MLHQKIRKSPRYDLVDLMHQGLQTLLCDFARGCELCAIQPSDLTLAEADRPVERVGLTPYIDAAHVGPKATITLPLTQQHKTERLVAVGIG